MASEQPALPPDLDGHRAYLYRYAMLQLRDPGRADGVILAPEQPIHLAHRQAGAAGDRLDAEPLSIGRGDLRTGGASLRPRQIDPMRPGSPRTRGRRLSFPGVGRLMAARDAQRSLSHLLFPFPMFTF